MKYLLLILWSALIFYLSSQPAVEVSDSINVNIFFHKSAHMFVYAVLYLCALLAFYKNKKKIVTAYKHAIIFCTAFAISDELHQLFTPTRSGKISDIFVDITGIIISFYIMRILLSSKIYKKVFKKS